MEILIHKFKKLLLLFIALILLVSFNMPSFAMDRSGTGKIAILFVDKDIIVDPSYPFSNGLGALRDGAYMLPVIKAHIEKYKKLGYQVTVLPDEEDTIIKSILDKRVKSISYFGHGGGKHGPEFGGMSASFWKNLIRTKLFKTYIKQGINSREARKRADEQSRNFGFESSSNLSCGSLLNNTMADVFVAPGGSYFGIKEKSYSPCSPFWYTASDVAEYRPAPNTQDSFDNLLNKLTDQKHLDSLNFDKILNSLNKQPKRSKKSVSKQYRALCAIGTAGIKMFVWDASGRRYGCQDRRMKLSNFSARKTPIIVGVSGKTGGKKVDCPIVSWPYKLKKVDCVRKNSHSPMTGRCAIYSLSGGKTKHCYYVE